MGVGSVICLYVNDVGFWMIKEYFGLSMKEIFLIWIIFFIIIFIVGLGFILLLDVFLIILIILIIFISLVVMYFSIFN